MIENEIYSVEYSASQECFHIDYLERVLMMNRLNCKSKNSVDYQIIAICKDSDEAQQIADEYRKALS